MIAIYARKSVFREDSISIESQIEQCRYEAKGAECVVYSDNGFSGKNTDRPEYQRMVEDIKDKKIDKVIVYKLDRISRSILDFSNMMNLFQKLNVAFVSATEHFDTSSPMGRAMLNICIVFAQLERETIQQRVADAYMSRSKKGFYMGGRIPYGYAKVPITIQGIKTSMYEPVKDEAEDIRFIYEMYARPETTLGDVTRALNQKGLARNRRGNLWSTARLSEFLQNPIYTFADKEMYDFYKAQGINIIDDIDQFTGETSLYLFKRANNLVIAPHIGLVDSETWLKCRRKLMKNKQVTPHKPTKFLFSGKVKCGYCGYSLTTVGSKRKNGYVYYLVDTGKTYYHACKHKTPTIRTDDFESQIVERIKAKIKTLTLQKKHSQTNDDGELNMLLIEQEKVSTEIDNILKALASTTNPLTMSYIESKITELDKKKQQINAEIEMVKKRHQDLEQTPTHLSHVTQKWNKLSFEDKRAVIEVLIDRISVFKDHVDIVWRL